MFITNKEKTIPSYVAKMHIPVSLAIEIPKLSKNGDKHKAIRPVWFGERQRRTTNKTQSSISNTLTAQYRRSTAKARKKGTFSLSQMSKASLLVLCHGEKTAVFIPKVSANLLYILHRSTYIAVQKYHFFSEK